MTLPTSAPILQWHLHKIARKSTGTIILPSKSEGFVQVVSGSCEVAVAEETLPLTPKTILWHWGRTALDVVADTATVLLQAWTPSSTSQSAVRQVRWHDGPAESLNPSLIGRSIAGEQLSAWLFEVKSGYKVRDICHAEEQLSCAISGNFEMFVGGVTTRMDSSVVTYVPTWEPHGGRFNDGAVELLEVFSPPRLGKTTQRAEVSES